MGFHRVCRAVTYLVLADTIIVRGATEGLDICAGIDVDTLSVFIGEKELGFCARASSILIECHAVCSTSGVHLYQRSAFKFVFAVCKLVNVQEKSGDL